MKEITIWFLIFLVKTSSLPGNYSSVWTDFDNDGKTDLYISKCLPNTNPGHPARTNLLYKNLGNQQFEETGTFAGVNDNAQSWTTVAEDFDHDGDIDFFVVNHDDKNRFYRNNGNGTFTDVISFTGIDDADLGAFEAYAADFNNDGNMDIISELQQNLYLGNGDLTFSGQKLPFVPGAMGDFNQDGFMDITTRSDVWINKGNSNHFIKLQLKGWESNHSGIGAKILLTSDGKTQTRELRAGQSYSPANTLDVHFGLGEKNIADSIKIIWPSGVINILTNLKTDTTYIIPEGPCILPSIALESDGSYAICPNETKLIRISSAFSAYLWNTGDTTRIIEAKKPGLYYLMYRDSFGCTGISQSIVLQHPDRFSPISVIPDDRLFCSGDTVTLRSESGKVFWSNGISETDRIFITESGNYYFFADSICGEGRYFSPLEEIVFTDVSDPGIVHQTYLNSDSVLIEAEGMDCIWFENESDTEPTYLGCRQIFPSDFNGKTLYVANSKSGVNRLYEGGKKDTLGFFNKIPEIKKMYFTIKEKILLKSVDLYFKNQGQNETVGIFILNQMNDTLYAQNKEIHQGRNTILLNIFLTPGIYTIFPDRPDILMNIGPLDYPYPIGNSGSIDSTSTGLFFYPYFYHWRFETEREDCISQKIPVYIGVNSAESFSDDKNIVLYPVPASETIILEGGQFSEKTKVIMYQPDGKSLAVKMKTEGKKIFIDITGLPPGIYWIVIDTNGKMIPKKVMILH